MAKGENLSRKGTPLALVDPELAKQAHGWDPAIVAAGSAKKLPWTCDRGHVWVAVVDNRVRKGVGCPYCSNFLALAGFNDLATVNPELAAQADGWDPSTVTPGSGRKAAWKCVKGHQWTSEIKSRTNGIGCPYCSGQRTIVGENDLVTTYPELAREAVGWDPTRVRHGGNERVLWRCPMGHEYQLSVAARVRGNGCTVCASKVIIAGVNDAASQYPELIPRSVTLDLATVPPSSGKRGIWRCDKGHEYEARVADKTRGRGCPVCANYLIITGVNDLATTNPELAGEAHGWDATTLGGGSGRNVEWICDLGHVWSTSPAQRLRGVGQGCPYCSGHRVWVGFNDLATTMPELAAEVHGWDPTMLTAGSNARRAWKCAEGHEWTAVVNSRRTGLGCPFCAESGYNPSKQGWLYLLRHERMELLQFGLTNVPDARLATHRAGGWEAIDLRGPMDGLVAAEWERSFQRLAKAKKLTMGKKLGVGKFTGYTEAWPAYEFKVESVRELMGAVEAWEDESQS